MKALILLLGVMVLLVNCNKKENDPKDDKFSELANVNFDYKPNLKKFDSCENLEKRFKDELTRKYKRNFYRTLKQISSWGFANDATLTTTATNESGDSSPSGGDGTQNEYSTTNVQEQGVDEGDYIKTDGKYIYAIRNNHFLILNAEDPNSVAIISDINLANQGENLRELYLYQNKIAIISNFYQYSNLDSKSSLTTYGIYRSFTKVRIYDTSLISSPVLKVEYLLPGYQNGSRLLGGGLYIVHKNGFNLPNPSYTRDYMTNINWSSSAEYKKAYKEAGAKALMNNLEKIKALTLDEFWPKYHKTLFENGSQTSQEGYAVGCTDFFIPESGNGTDIGIITRIDLDSADFTTNSSGILTSWGEIYMSVNNLYISSRNRWMWIMPLAEDSDLDNPEPLTGLHKFDISSGENNTILYKGSGLVKGWVNNQFSFSEDQGYLRVGTTRGGWWGENISNQLVILYAKDGELIEAGKIEGLAPGERIYSMRYDGKRGYMVTFRMTDPLFTFDLSDPFNPKMTGEIEVSGFSTYIHIFGENNNRLLTIGRSAGANGWITGNKLQIFDVSDLTNPTLTDSYELGSGWSKALYDHHAFLYYQPKSLLAIPYSSWNYSGSSYSYSTGLKLFNIIDSQISLKGEIAHPDLSSQYYWNSSVDRSLVIGNFIYSMSGQYILANNLDDLSTSSTVTLPERDYSNYYYYD